jgi:hypothetical protein
MLPLLRSGPLLPEFPPFMLDVLEVVDSPVESPKCVDTRIGQEPEATVQNSTNRIDTRIRQELEAPVQNSRNWIVRFSKLDGPILSIPTTVRGASNTRRGSFSSSQAASR